MVGIEKKKNMHRVQERSAHRLQPVSNMFKTHPLEGVGEAVEGGGFVRFEIRLHRREGETQLSRSSKNFDISIMKSQKFGHVYPSFYTLARLRGGPAR